MNANEARLAFGAVIEELRGRKQAAELRIERAIEGDR